MIRLLVPIFILLLTLFGGAVWLLHGYLGMPEQAVFPPATTSPSVAKNEPPPAPESSAPAAAPADDSQGSFDVARVDPKGTSVFAGRADPGADVTIMADGQAIGSTRADENGEWTFSTEHPFANADPKLALKTGAPSESPAQDATSQAKVASEAQPQGQKPDSEQRTANAVTSHLLKNLEGMVAEARKADTPKATPPQAPAAAPPPATPPQASAPTPPQTPAAAAPPASPQTPATQTPPGKIATAEPPSAAAPSPSALAQSKMVPVPIMFVFNEAAFTADGKKAAGLLLEYLQLKHFKKISLTGHADERGTDGLNMDLSKERLDAVAHYLRNNGFKGELDLIPKGELQPFSGVVRSQYPLDELYQLDRRVELVISP